MFNKGTGTIYNMAKPNPLKYFHIKRNYNEELLHVDLIHLTQYFRIT